MCRRDTGDLIVMRDVRKIYQMGEVEVEALHVDELTIKRGEFVAILGPSGSGKTTLLNLIGGIDAPTSGSIMFDGADISALNRQAAHAVPPRERRLRLPVLQPDPHAHRRGERALRPRTRRRATATPPDRDPQHCSPRSGSPSGRTHFPAQLSGGEQQRVAVARALAKAPKLILGDEPTGNLDFRTGKLVLAALREVNREEGAAVVLVTHNQPLAAIADRVLQLRDGAIVEERSTRTRSTRRT